MISAEIQEKIHDLGQVLEYMYSIAKEYHGQLQEVKAGKELLEERIISQKEELDNQYNELRKAYDADKDKWNSSLADWKASIDSLNKIRIADEKILDERRQELSSKEANFEIRKKKVNEQLEEREKSVAERELLMNELQDEVKVLKKENNDLMDFNVSLKEKLENQREKYKRLKDNNDDLIKEYNELKFKNEELIKKNNEFEKNIREYKIENVELQQKVKEFNEIISKQSAYRNIFNDPITNPEKKAEGSDNRDRGETVSRPTCARNQKSANQEQEEAKEVRETDIEVRQETNEEAQEGEKETQAGTKAKVSQERGELKEEEFRDSEYLYNR